MTDGVDLYEFPDDYIGRKRYVSVRGHSKSVPAYKTYRGSDGRNYVHPDFGGTWDGMGNQAAYYMPDKLAYFSPMDGSRIESRSAHREHMNRHNVYEAGDLKPGDMSRGRNNSPLPPVQVSIKQAIEQIRSR